MKEKTYNFSCWVIKYDGRSICERVYKKNSLNSNDKITVPLCWNHNHFDPSQVLGTAILESRDDGIYAYCTLNDNPNKEDIIKLLKDRGAVSISPFVSNIKYNGNLIVSGVIREVSLVLCRIDPDEDYYPVLKEGDV